MEIKDFITFGASVRVKNAEKRYENCVEEYNKIFKEMEIRKSEVEEELKLLVEEKIEALRKTYVLIETYG